MNRCLPLMLAIVLAFTFAAVFRARPSPAAEPTPRTAGDVFRSRQIWKDLPSGFIDALAAKLSSAEKAKEFATLTENTGILQNNIIKFANQDPAFALGSVAATLTSYANAMGAQRRFTNSKRALEMALLVRPRHLAAWMSMALVGINTGDCTTAVAYADRVLTFKPNPASDDPWEAAQAESVRPESGWDEIKTQMTQIKDLCRKRS